MIGNSVDLVKAEHPHIRVERLDSTRNGRAVLRDVSASFERGICNVILGPSGAGKTSLLRCLNALDVPAAGTVYLDGSDAQEIPPTELRRRVGMICQVPVLLPGSVRDNLLYEFDGTETDVEVSLHRAGLRVDLLDRPAHQLSTGQAQRVCIARALIRSPDVLLMDEPTSSLDKDAAARVEETVESLRREGLTVIFVTHDLEQARRLGSRALLLVNGEVGYQGGVGQLDDVWAAGVP